MRLQRIKRIDFLSILTLLACIGLPAYRCQAQTERYEPVYFDGKTSLSLAPDPRFHLGKEGSVELWIAAPEEIVSKADSVTVLKHGDDKSTDFRVFLDKTRKSVGIQLRDDFLGIAPCDFTDGQFHHLTFVTEEDFTNIFVDDNPPVTFQGGYAPPIPDGRPFYIGADEKSAGFTGWLYTVRLWNKGLSAADLSRLKNFYGLPEEKDPAYNNLVGYSYFTNNQRAFKFTQPEIFSTHTVGGQGDKASLDFFTPGLGEYRVSSVYVQSDAKGVKQIIVELSAPGRVPVFLPPRPGRPGLQISVTRTAAAAARDRGEKAQFDSFVKQIRQLELGFDDQNGVVIAADGGWQIFRLRPGEFISGVAGTHDGQSLQSIRFFSYAPMLAAARQTSPLFGTNKFSLKSFMLEVPQHATFMGFNIRTGPAGGLTSIGMAYMFPPVTKEESAPLSLSYGRWIERDLDKPHRLLPNERNGTYTDYHVYKMIYHRGGVNLTLARDDGQSFEFQRTSRPDVYQCSSNCSGQLTLYDDGFELLGTTFTGQPTRFVHPEPYEVGGDDKIQWGGTFSLEQRPSLAKANFRGYNVFLLHPRDYQSYTGSSKLLFKYPAEDSKDYYSTDNKLIVPHGLYFKSDNLGTERAETKTVSNSAEYATEWGVQLGAEVGVPEVASFSLNASYNNERQVASAREFRTSIARTTQTKYGLILDKSRMELNDEFRDRVLELRDELRATDAVDPANYANFLRAFGTHYANAITYGGMAYLEVDFTSSQLSTFSSDEVKLALEAKASLEISVGVSAGGNLKVTDKLGAAVSAEQIRFGAYGGEISRGQGWSMPKGEEVPLYLDLRPIYELLSPIYFDDEIVWTKLREGLKDAFKKLTNQVAGQS
jgi:hypothetical protein